MPLTKSEVEQLEKVQSRYGCGATDCLACYPIIYRCGGCGIDYPQPIKNGECFYCFECEFCEACGAY